jgi:hypothetical protein
MTPALPLLPLAAHAAAPDAVTHRVSVETGLGGPLGAAGVAWTVEPAAGLRLETGVGAGFSGAQFSVMPSRAWGSPRRRFAMGAGVSWASDCCVWVNLEAARGEWTSPAGAQFFVAAGASVPSNSWREGIFVGWDAFVPQPYVRVGVGCVWDEPPAQPGSVRPRHLQRLGLQAGYLEGGDLSMVWTVAPGPWTYLDVSAGAGGTNSDLRLGAMAGVSVGGARARYVGGLGVVAGTPSPCLPPSGGASPCADGSGPLDELWLRADLVGLEHRSPNGVSLTVAAGFTRAMRVMPLVEPSTAPWWSNEGSFFRDAEPHVRVGVGYWL